jgi:biopolymer transport protein ExbD
MAFNMTSDQQVMSEINVTPLVDVMLVLLVIFIVTAPLLMQSIQVKLPKTDTVSPLTKNEQIKLTIDAQGKYYIEQRPILTDALVQELVNRKMAGMTSVQIDADEAVSYGRVAQALAMINHAGITRLAFVTVPQ